MTGFDVFFRGNEIEREIEKIKHSLKEIRELKQKREQREEGDFLKMLRESLLRTERNRLLVNLYQEVREINLEEERSEEELRRLLAEIEGRRQPQQQRQQQLSAQQKTTFRRAVSFAVANFKAALAALQGDPQELITVAAQNPQFIAEFLATLKNEKMRKKMRELLESIK